MFKINFTFAPPYHQHLHNQFVYLGMAIKVSHKLAVIDSELLTEYILATCGKMSHLKLQKLLYYVQAFHLAYFDGYPLIEDEFEAWLHGPVSKKVYDKVRDFAVLYNDIEFTGDGEGIIATVKHRLSSEQLTLIDDVLKEYSTLTGTQLENLTHSEAPWINARKECGFGDACRVIIPKTEMASYYKGQLYGDR